MVVFLPIYMLYEISALFVKKELPEEDDNGDNIEAEIEESKV